ncbi:MAG: metallophosphoesterase [Clostridia bacterium]|nr:metallophosphoesterase [Clostridia bacterium]
MKILVISDTHKNTQMLRRALDNHPEIVHVFHLGDHTADVDAVREDYPDKTFYCVCGNNDFGSQYAPTGVCELNGRTIYYTHGHLQRVHDHLHNLIAEAKHYGADIALFGHTHISCTIQTDGVFLFNPGSASRPRMGNRSYGIIELDELLFIEQSL